MRKLSSIQKITKLEEITGADKIVKATVLGWNTVVLKDEFKENDLCVFFEIDSILDESNPSYNHLKKDGKLKHLKTKKLKGVLSQGLALPLSCLHQYGQLINEEDGINLIPNDSNYHIIHLEIGTDLTYITKTEKYEIQLPACLTGLAKGNFPHYLRKTDEDRAQNFPEVLNEVKDVEMIGTMKLDGSSATFYLKDDEFGVCSRNLNLKESENNAFWMIARKLDIEKKMREYRDYAIQNGFDFSDFSIQGELCGENIQGNKMKLIGHHLFLFNFWDITNQKYRSFETFQTFCKLKDLKTVPIVFQGIIPSELLSVESILRYVDSLDYPNGGPAEGIVWRPTIERFSTVLNGRLSFKTISNRFLLSMKE